MFVFLIKWQTILIGRCPLTRTRRAHTIFCCVHEYLAIFHYARFRNTECQCHVLLLLIYFHFRGVRCACHMSVIYVCHAAAGPYDRNERAEINSLHWQAWLMVVLRHHFGKMHCNLH